MHKANRYFSVFLFLFLCMGVYAQEVQAVPALTKEKTFIQPNGTTFIGKMWGDEELSGYETKDNYTIIKDDKSGYWYYADVDSNMQLISNGILVGKGIPSKVKQNLRPKKYKNVENRVVRRNIAQTSAYVSSMGVAKFPVLLVNFNDTSPTYKSTDLNQLLFGTGSGGVVSGPGTLKDYYKEVSNSKFNIEGVVSNWYTAKNNHDLYAESQDPNNVALLIKEAVQALDASIDFSKFDNDGDGKVDNLIVIHQGLGAEVGDETSIWSHNASLSDTGVGAIVADGKSINTYTIQPEKYDNDTMVGIGVFAHEIGHALGLPDLYDIDESSEGVGDWCLMAGGSWGTTVHEGDTPVHLSAWCKSKLGWVTPQVISKNTLQKGMEPIENSPDNVYQIRDNPEGVDWSFDNHSGDGEYFLIENRQKLKFDAALPGAGLLIWHIDESVTCTNSANTNEEGSRLVALEQADGHMDLENGKNRGDFGDPFPGSSQNRNFNSLSNPDSNLYDGSDSNISLSNITQVNNSITLDITVEEKDINIYLQSNHPYKDLLDYTWEYTLPGEHESIEVTFDARTEVEDYLDFIYVMDKNNNVIENGKFTGKALQGRTISIPGNTVKVRLTSDYRDHYWGFRIVDVKDPNAASSINLNKNTMALGLNQCEKLSYTISPITAINKTVTWISKDDKVATVDEEGNVKAVGIGSTEIIVETANGVKATCKVSVISMTLNKNALAMKIGDKTLLKTIVTPIDVVNPQIVWKSSNTNIATVDNQGNVIAKGNGKVIIYARYAENNQISAQCTVTISTPVTAIKLSSNSVKLSTLENYNTVKLSAVITPYNAADKTVTWISDNKAVATVDKNGLVTARRKGKANIIAKTSNGSVIGKCVITVIPVESIMLKQSNLTLILGKSTILNAQVMPLNAFIKDVTWKSSDNTIATVDAAGKVKALKKGIATITVTTKDGRYTASCKVVVVKKIITSIKLDRPEIILMTTTRNIYKLIPTITPSNADYANITWKSSNSAVATVSKDGSVRAIKAGTVIITATTLNGGKIAICRVSVIPVSSVTLDRNNSIKVGELNVIRRLTSTVATVGGNAQKIYCNAMLGYIYKRTGIWLNI